MCVICGSVLPLSLRVSHLPEALIIITRNQGLGNANHFRNSNSA